MVTPLQSRFAVLSIDDTGDNPRKLLKNLNKKKTENKQTQNVNQTKNEPKKKKKKPEGQSQSIPSCSKSKNKAVKNEAKQKKQQQEQWEEWKQKDSELADGTYENDLHQAILQSKLDYEENKELYEQLRKEQEEEKKQTQSKKKKSNKAQPMTLGQFNSLTESQNEVREGAGGDVQVNGKLESDPEFFDRVKADAKKVFTSEQAAEKKKAMEPFIDEIITAAQFKDRLDQCSKENAELKEEVVRLKEELQNVKTRNKKLCHILGQGEMKDKAALLVEVETLKKVRDELSAEVTNLHAQLEQERSKSRIPAGDTKTKDKNKKRTTSETVH